MEFNQLLTDQRIEWEKREKEYIGKIQQLANINLSLNSTIESTEKELYKSTVECETLRKLNNYYKNKIRNSINETPLKKSNIKNECTSPSASCDSDNKEEPTTVCEKYNNSSPQSNVVPNVNEFK